MAQQPYTVLKGAVGPAAAGWSDLFTALQGYVTIARHIAIANASGNAVQVRILWSYQAAAIYLINSSVPANGQLLVDLRQVVPAGAAVALWCDAELTSAAVTCYELRDELPRAEQLPV